MIHRERICPCVLFYEARAFRDARGGKGGGGEKKFAAYPPSLRFSYPNNYDAGGAGTYLDAEISFRNVREIFFQRPAKPLQIHAVYDIIASGESFVSRLRFTPAIEQYNSRCDIFKRLAAINTRD